MNQPEKITVLNTCTKYYAETLGKKVKFSFPQFGKKKQNFIYRQYNYLHRKFQEILKIRIPTL